MSQFFTAILLITFGGLASLVLSRQAILSKGLAVVLIGAGCFWGFIDAVTRLLGSAAGSASFQYLNAFSLTFKIDGLSAFFLVVIFAVCMLAAVYSFHYMNGTDTALKNGVNYFFFSILVVSMALVVTAANMITFMLAWEIMSLSSFFLVVYNHGAEENRKAGYLYFVFSHVGAMFIFAGFGVLFGYTGGFGFDGIDAVPETAKLLIFIFTFIGFGSKAGVFPFHVWLPHAHPAAPSHISAVMSGVMIKTGIYGMLRVYSLLDFHTPVTGYIVLLAGVVSGILGVVYALGQHDIKRLLAYSSVENVGIILIGLGVGMTGVAAENPLMAVLGFSGGLLHVLNHSVFKSLLFMGAGMVLHQTGTRSIDALGGLLKTMKITGTAFIIGSLAISGLPPFNGFAGEFFIYIGSFKGVALQSLPFVVSIIAIVSLAIIGGLALACFTKVVGVVFQGEPRTAAAENVTESGSTMLFSMGVLAAACAIIGIFPRFFLNMAVTAVSALNLGYERIPMEPFQQMTSNITVSALVFLVVVCVVAVVRSVYYRQKTIGSGGTWGCGFTQPTVKMQYTGYSFSGDIFEFFRPVAPMDRDHPPIQGRFPDKTHYRSQVNDIAERHMNGIVVRPVMYFFDRLRWIQHGDIHLYIGYILLAIVLLLFFI